jgi:2-hydroxy-6-oxo-6-(2'-aminophenyl)hexa-2,4-dienoate hydrolase
MNERFVDAGGIRTRYFEDGEGAPVVLVHGGGAGADSRGNWKGCIPLLAHRFRVLAMDMVGFGGTEKPPPGEFQYTQDARVRHLIAFLEAVGVGRASLVGNSMGGATALGVAMKRPELADKLVLMGSAGLTTQISESIRVILSFAPSRENMEKLVRVLTSESFHVDPELIDYRLALTREPGTMEAYGATMKWVAEQGGLFYPEEEIRRVKNKTLVIGGKQDEVVPPETNWRFSELLENSWLHLIPHCGHWAMIEKPEEFSEVAGWFLANA